MAIKFRFSLIKYISAPRVKGSLLYKNTSNCTFRYTGFHGTRLHLIQDQMKQGRFGNQNKDLYMYPNWEWNAQKAAFWAKNKPDAVLVEVGSNTPPLKNRAFKTLLFPKNAQEIAILRVWAISRKWLEYAWKRSPKN